jgi:ADP-dependent NAD(P)H-hydrate dehydratase
MKPARPVSINDLSRFPLPTLADTDDKEGRGSVLVVAGGAQVPGAGILTGLAALRAGAGKLRIAATRPCAIALGIAVPEAAILATPCTPAGEISPAGALAVLADAASRTDAVVVGPGMMDEAGAARLALALIAAANDAAFVIDAAALTGLDLSVRDTQALNGRLVVTPHAGEMAKLIGRDKKAVRADPVGAALQVSEALEAVVVMKGQTTFVVTPERRIWRHDGGVVGLGTSGSGDVLAGVIAGCLARGASPETAAIWGVCAHAQAGVILSEKMGAVGLLARELLAEIPGVMNGAAAA